MKRTPMAGIDLPGNLPLAWEALAARDAEIERLKAELSENEGVIRVWRRRTEEAEALVEKRERQLVWALRNGAHLELSNLQSGLDIVAVFGVRIAVDGTDAGLLAAIDEATQETSDPR